MNYYKPWISEEGPKLPKGWGLAIITRVESVSWFNCNKCNKRIEWKQQYLYSFQPDGTPVLHNTEECTEELRGKD